MNEEFGDFLEFAIGVRGPFHTGHERYLEALRRVLDEAGLSA